MSRDVSKLEKRGPKKRWNDLLLIPQPLQVKRRDDDADDVVSQSAGLIIFLAYRHMDQKAVSARKKKIVNNSLSLPKRQEGFFICFMLV